MKSVVNATRLGDFQIFGRGTWANERSLSAEIGIVTYDDNDHYEVSSYTLGLRSDHLSNAVSSFLGDEQPRESIHAPLAGDAELLAGSETRTIYRRDGVDIDAKADREERKATRESIKRMEAERGKPVSLTEAAAA